MSTATKLNCDSCPSTPQWSKSLKHLPFVKESDIEAFAANCKIPRQQTKKGYSNFVESFVHDVQFQALRSLSDEGCYVRAKCYRSMRKNEPPHSLRIRISNLDGLVVFSEQKCTCAAGEGDCNHILGLLYLLHHYCMSGFKTVPPIVSKTSLPQAWHVPRTHGVKPKKISEMNIKKIKLPKCNKENIGTGTTRTTVAVSNTTPKKKLDRKVQGICSTFYNPVPTPLPCTQFISSLSKNLAAVNSKAQIRSCLTNVNFTMVESAVGPVPRGCILSYQQPVKLLDSPDNISNYPSVSVFPSLSMPIFDCGVSYVLLRGQQDVYDGIITSLEDSIDIELHTRDQSWNDEWHALRNNRLTSSNFKRIGSRKADLSTLAQQLHNCSNRRVTTNAMKYGIENEGTAANLYVDKTGRNIYQSGFIINPSCSYLGTSPDRKVFDPHSKPPFGLLEIKCPSSVTSVTDLPYLQLVDKSYKLRTSHAYYHQVMGQMALTGLEWCDFFVMCNDDYHLERIHFNSDLWNEMKVKLDLFYFYHYLFHLSNCK